MRIERVGLWVLVALLGFPCVSAAQAPSAGELTPLPEPQREGGMALMQALALRHSSREFSSRTLPPQVLSNLLWAAYGINRPETGGRTAPSPYNRQETRIYLTVPDGVFVYEPKSHALRRISNQDIRGLTGTQPYVAEAPLNLVYVADVSKFSDSEAPQTLIFLGASTGTIAQNVYLFCASSGLSTVVRGLIDRDKLSAALGLGDDLRITLAQSIGYPK